MGFVPIIFGIRVLFEVVLNDENYIYRVDTTAAFHLSDWQLSKAGLDIDSPNGNIQQATRKMMLDSLKKKIIGNITS